MGQKAERVRNKIEMFFLSPLLKVGVLSGSVQPPLLSSHYTLYLGALIPASHYHTYAGGSPVYFCSLAFSFREAGLCTQLPSVYRCNPGPRSQHVKTEFIIFLFNLSLSSNGCPDKQHHHPPWLPETSHPPYQTSHGSHPLLFTQNPLQPVPGATLPLFRAACTMEPVGHWSRLPCWFLWPFWILRESFLPAASTACTPHPVRNMLVNQMKLFFLQSGWMQH